MRFAHSGADFDLSLVGVDRRVFHGRATLVRPVRMRRWLEHTGNTSPTPTSERSPTHCQSDVGGGRGSRGRPLDRKGRSRVSRGDGRSGSRVGPGARQVACRVDCLSTVGGGADEVAAAAVDQARARQRNRLQPTLDEREELDHPSRFSRRRLQPDDQLGTLDELGRKQG